MSPDSLIGEPMNTPLAYSACEMERVPECPRPMIVIMLVAPNRGRAPLHRPAATCDARS
jgi:hypothetical protein